MGGICSKKSNGNNKKANPYGKTNGNGVVSYENKQHISSTQQVKESKEKKELQAANLKQESFLNSKNDIGDEFYDGIPRYPSSSIKSRSIRRQAAVAKVSEVSSRLSRVGSVGLGKAVEVLDTLGSSMTNLNPQTFTSSVATKGNELGILAFEVANTVVKGSNLMQSLSVRSVRHLKEEVLPSEGVQNLISKDMDELLRIVAADKREELKIFSGEVVRFGNRCKDPQWHNLDRYFEKISRDRNPRRQLQEEAESIMELLMILVQFTAELYHELQILDRMEHECQRREGSAAANQRGESLAMLKAEIKSQKKRIRNVKKKSLWSRSLEEVMEKLVDIIHFLILEIGNAFGSGDDSVQDEESVSNNPRLGPAGLSLHYANVVMQIDNLLTITEIKDTMEKTLQWLVPLSTNTAKVHHGFGWVGEWASSGSEANRKPAAGAADIIQIETLHHADKEKTEAYILEQLLWLHHLVSKTKSVSSGVSIKSPAKSAIGTQGQKSNQKQEQESPNAADLPDAVTSNAPPPTTEDQKILQDASEENQIEENSKSQDINSVDTKLREDGGLSTTNNNSPRRKSEDSATVKNVPSALPIRDIGIDKEEELDKIDRVDVLRYKGKPGLVTAKT
ncbi:protein PSK SIMULATOR 1 isoform X2 [Populus trichocarpa]|uniref:protein PSK SIMULATOR 1 isoform X2 n=1 Tax=Populus trichocarpa TaxID=3694 RepID=UPI0022798B67|nr:protein PSK SIMULATOR 1 isoform X2 [Populus trichocarpa]